MSSPEERLGELLGARGLTIAVAESCTGGLIASRITDVAGASDYFLAGLVTYSNAAKGSFLHVPEEMLAAKGAVSRETAGKMAEGVRGAIGADIGLSVTGIAGPGGGTPQKPVGTVYMGLAVKEGVYVRRHMLAGSRLSIKQQSADRALAFVIDYLEGRPL
jgi:nicotinamide-nucleotide amidase